ncbi:MAG: UDP-N-acetylmuramate dehydrogenase [Verrucomicrobiales bacterium]|nr:UDP-N-acetylmuramate dehydrogenase [Verrucomicrobiales bacterium]
MNTSTTFERQTGSVARSVDDLAEWLARHLSPSSHLRLREPMSRRTTLRVGGEADLLLEAGTEADLAEAVRAARSRGVPWMVLGRGSNLLVRDGGIRGLVLTLNQPYFSRIEVHGVRLHCGAGARLKDLSAEARRCGLGGLEFLGGIPGSVGGAMRMNAGAWNAAVFDRLDRLRFMSAEGEVQELPAAQVPFSYRRCDLFRNHIALAADFVGEPSTPSEVEARARDLNERRWKSQPAAPSAGCIFKNPAALPAGRLVDELGLKGTRIGGAVVSDVHGNFIVNEGGATAADVLALIELIRTRAREVRGIELETEVEIIGE